MAIISERLQNYLFFQNIKNTEWEVNFFNWQKIIRLLYFGSQPGIEGFYEKNGCQKIKITERTFMNKEYLQYLIDTITDKDNLKKVKEEAIKLSNSYSPEEYTQIASELYCS